MASAALVLAAQSCKPRTYTAEEVLSSILIIDSLKMIENDSTSNFTSTYEVWFRMPIDHQNPSLGYFPLRAFYSHRDFERPMVAVLDGYTMYTSKCNELTRIIDGNQLTIEHRFFANSRPADSIPWAYLNVKQAAADQHDIIQAFRKFYRGKWVSTGISKSGQTTIFHRSIYPQDVEASVPYVAPLNFSNQDPRVYEFLKTVGNKEDRDKIYAYQIALFKNKKKILPLFEQLATEKGWEFKMGLDRAYDLSVLEYAFSFWQWGTKAELIPDPKAKPEVLFAHLKQANPFTFFEEKSIENVRPFFFQSMTEVGMYGYEVEPFKQYLSDTADVLFDFTMPPGWQAKFNPETMLAVDRWVKNEGNNMLYIYGEYDAWSATAVELTTKTNAVKMVNPKGCHRTRIKSFPQQMQDSIYTVLELWLDVDLDSLKSVK